MSKKSTPAVPGEVEPLLKHFREMQSACTDYLVPETYVRRFPEQNNRHHTEFEMPDPLHSDVQRMTMQRRRDQAFIGDIIRMLDGPEQRAAESALSAPLPEIEGGDKGDGWQPIDTAPKDGKTILIAARGVVRTAWWGAAAFNRKTKGYDRGWTDGPNHGFEPTHWMPFPAAPSASIEGETKP